MSGFCPEVTGAIEAFCTVIECAKAQGSIEGGVPEARDVVQW